MKSQSATTQSLRTNLSIRKPISKVAPPPPYNQRLVESAKNFANPLILRAARGNKTSLKSRASREPMNHKSRDLGGTRNSPSFCMGHFSSITLRARAHTHTYTRQPVICALQGLFRALRVRFGAKAARAYKYVRARAIKRSRESPFAARPVVLRPANFSYTRAACAPAFSTGERACARVLRSLVLVTRCVCMFYAVVWNFELRGS